MNMSNTSRLFGVGLVAMYTVLISSADAITKFIARGYAAPQLFFVSAAIVVALTVLTSRLQRKEVSFSTSCPRAMTLRSALTVVGSLAFFYAFKLLPFAEVFVFIGMVPLFAGAMSGMILKESVGFSSWAALLLGFAGVLFLFPDGVSSATWGHAVALFACLTGTLSMILARFISRYEQNDLAQVLYPNLALCVTMGFALPFVYVAMPIADMVWVLAYAVVLFLARWVLVVSLRLLNAYVVTPLMNLQFVWMVVMGAMFFGEVPGVQLYIGVTIIVLSGLYLVYEQTIEQPTAKAIKPPRQPTLAGKVMVEKTATIS
jgi:S-adenosylmethionine uptake transporter